ncbi:MAG: hypothetical protein ACJAUW_000223 [Yoonia sp.]
MCHRHFGHLGKIGGRAVRALQRQKGKVSHGVPLGC